MAFTSCLQCLSFPNSHITEFSDVSLSLLLHSLNGWWKEIREIHLAPSTFRTLPSPPLKTAYSMALSVLVCFVLCFLGTPQLDAQEVTNPFHNLLILYMTQHPGYSLSVATSTCTGGKRGGLGHPRTPHINCPWRLKVRKLELESQLLSAFFPSTYLGEPGHPGGPGKDGIRGEKGEPGRWWLCIHPSTVC